MARALGSSVGASPKTSRPPASQVERGLTGRDEGSATSISAMV